MSLSPSFIAHILELQASYRGMPLERILLGKGPLTREERHYLSLQLGSEPSLSRKLPSWHTAGVFLPTPLALEQCSSEEAARYKQRFVQKGEVLLDMTGGFGVDFTALASEARSAVYIERQAELVAAARFNLPRLLPAKDLVIIEGESLPQLEGLLATYQPSLIFLDPARREGQDTARRVYAIEDCEPDLHRLLPELHTLVEELQLPHFPRLLVKLSPMLDVVHTLRSIPGVKELHVVSVRGEAKELLLLIDLEQATEKPQPEEVTIIAQDLRPDGSVPEFSLVRALAQEEQEEAHYARAPLRYLFEPHAALMKTGLFRSIGRAYGLEALHPNTHLYTSEHLPEGKFPGRVFEVERIYPFASSQLKAIGREIQQAEITCRNFPLRPEALRSRLRLKDGGTKTLLALTASDGAHLLILCHRL